MFLPFAIAKEKTYVVGIIFVGPSIHVAVEILLMNDLCLDGCRHHGEHRSCENQFHLSSTRWP